MNLGTYSTFDHDRCHLCVLRQNWGTMQRLRMKYALRSISYFSAFFWCLCLNLEFGQATVRSNRVNADRDVHTYATSIPRSLGRKPKRLEYRRDADLRTCDVQACRHSISSGFTNHTMRNPDSRLRTCRRRVVGHHCVRTNVVSRYTSSPYSRRRSL